MREASIPSIWIDIFESFAFTSVAASWARAVMMVDIGVSSSAELDLLINVSTYRARHVAPISV